MKPFQIVCNNVVFAQFIFLIFIMSCGSDGFEKIDYWDDGSILVRTYKNKLDTSTYERKYYYPNGVLGTEGIIKNAKEDGKWIWYFSDGKLKWVDTYKGGISIDTTFCYHETGYLERIVFPMIDGKREAIEYYSNRVRKIESSFSEAELGHGKYIKYYENGNMETMGELREGQKVGIWKYYYENGKFKESVDYTEENKLIEN